MQNHGFPDSGKVRLGLGNKSIFVEERFLLWVKCFRKLIKYVDFTDMFCDLPHVNDIKRN